MPPGTCVSGAGVHRTVGRRKSNTKHWHTPTASSAFGGRVFHNEGDIMNDLEKLFLRELKDIYDGEQQLVKALPEMEQSAVSQELKTAFHEHFEQTRNHVNRLETVFRTLGEAPERKSCKGLEGIIDEGESMAKEFVNNSALDAVLIESGQKAEHYEITSYGTLCTWAEQLGKTQALELLKQNLDEEKQTDARLTQIAEFSRNRDPMYQDTPQKRGIWATLTGR
jgi:ferritin-like metal-binding protein YciE